MIKIKIGTKIANEIYHSEKWLIEDPKFKVYKKINDAKPNSWIELDEVDAQELLAEADYFASMEGFDRKELGSAWSAWVMLKHRIEVELGIGQTFKVKI
jgi:hypothetical protein